MGEPEKIITTQPASPLPLERGLHALSFSGEGPTAGYGRIYLGDDFCERLIPDAQTLKNCLDFTGRNGKELTLLTPYCTEKGLDALKPVLKDLETLRPGTEVVVNDLGVLRLLKKDHRTLVPVLGRLYTSLLLSPFFRTGLRIFTPGDRVQEFQTRRFALADEYFAFFRENGISRVDFDNPFLLPIFAGQFIREGLNISLYSPFTYFTVSRRCLFAGRGRFSNKFALLGCKKECLEHRLILRNPSLRKKLFVKGNAQFIHNDPKLDIESECKKWGADRLVTFAP